MSTLDFYDFQCLIPVPNQHIQLGNNELTLNQNTHFPRPPSSHISNINNDDHYPDILLTRHHVVPFNLFRNFFALLSSLAVGNDADVYRDIINRNVETLSSVYIDTYASDVTRYISSSGTSGGVVITPNDILRQAITDFIVSDVNSIAMSRSRMQHVEYVLNNDLLFVTLAAWLPGNVFLGPTPNVRTDDPGEGFEINSRNIIGDERYDLALELYNNLNSFNRNADVGMIERIFSSINDLAHLNVIDFNSNYWDKNTVVKKNKDVLVWKIKKRNRRDAVLKSNIVNAGIKLGGFCDPLDLLGLIYLNFPRAEEKCKEDVGFAASVKRFFVGSKCNKIIHDELKK